MAPSADTNSLDPPAPLNSKQVEILDRQLAKLTDKAVVAAMEQRCVAVRLAALRARLPPLRPLAHAVNHTPPHAARRLTVSILTHVLVLMSQICRDRPKLKQRATREAIRRDRKLTRLGLHGVADLPRPGELPRLACALPGARRQMQAGVRSTPAN